MKSRWYVGTSIIILLSLLGGLASKQQIAIPNQEIVLQFTSDEITPEDAQNTIASVKQQLHNAGVEHIEVLEQQDGQLKIIYYSITDVESIKKLLTNADGLGIQYTEHSDKQSKKSSKKHTVTYDLDVFEIQNGYDSVLNSAGKLAIELKSENIRYVNPNFYVPFVEIDLKESNRVIKIAYNFQRSVAITIDNFSHIIPEVRAGPHS